jgi:hypothetical protein
MIGGIKPESVLPITWEDASDKFEWLRIYMKSRHWSEHRKEECDLFLIEGKLYYFRKFVAIFPQRNKHRAKLELYTPFYYFYCAGWANFMKEYENQITLPKASPIYCKCGCPYWSMTYGEWEIIGTCYNCKQKVSLYQG